MKDGMNFNGIDGKGLLDALLLANAVKDKKNDAVKVFRVFQKHGLSLVNGMAMLMEVAAALEGGDENDG